MRSFLFPAFFASSSLLLACGSSSVTHVTYESDAAPSSSDGSEVDAAGDDGGSGDAGQTVTLQIGGQTVTGVLWNGGFTLTSLPTSFTAPFNATWVTREMVSIPTLDALKTSCGTAIGPIDEAGPPAYTVSSVLVNPLASDVILRALSASPEVNPQDVSTIFVVNPVTVTALTFSDPSLQAGIPASATEGASGVQDVGERSVGAWEVLCAGATLGKNPVASLTFTGTAGGQPYTGTVSFTPLTVSAAP
jgi:hypothetical protein